MVKYWAKVINEEKIVKSATLEFANLNVENFHDIMSQICYGLDLPTPMILDKHINNLKEYSAVIFTPSDFVESVNFNKLIVEVF